uniref:Uncharacterized protein n=1 Tax=Rhizophora mucronata TaxID=61149 RepID=A0A2P2QRJ8_RHIMU
MIQSKAPNLSDSHSMIFCFNGSPTRLGQPI